jgi:hypothetical protein
MLTLLTIPRAFAGDVDLLQRNAIESWRCLGNVQIILCGDDEGVADAARELGCQHYAPLRRSELGTPRLDDAFAAGDRLAAHDLLCYINTDIILTGDFLPALAAIREPRFLVIGRRINLEVSTRIACDQPGWDRELLERAEHEGWWAPPIGSDYFIYRRGSFGSIPPFAVGRAYWDNWMMFRALDQDWPLIDATDRIQAIHQMHSYEHLPQSSGPTWDAPEAKQNLRYAGGHRALRALPDATHSLQPNGAVRLRRARYPLLRWQRRLTRLPGSGTLRATYRAVRGFWRTYVIR